MCANPPFAVCFKWRAQIGHTRFPYYAYGGHFSHLCGRAALWSGHPPHSQENAECSTDGAVSVGDHAR